MTGSAGGKGEAMGAAGREGEREEESKEIGRRARMRERKMDVLNPQCALTLLLGLRWTCRGVLRLTWR